MVGLENWKNNRLKIIEEFVGGREYILLRGPGSWSKSSDVDIYCPTFPQNKDLIRYDIKGVPIDVFKNYKIKKININFEVLKEFKINSSNELIPDIESCIFYLKDYVHFSKYRKNKHKYYGQPKNMQQFLEKVDFSKINPKLLIPSYSMPEYYMKSILVKINYYLF